MVSAVLALALSSALSFSLLAPTAQADDLTDHRARVKQQLAKTRSDLNESSRALTAAGVAVDRAQDQLQTAQARLAKTRQEQADAQARDEALAAKLERAKVALVAARQAVVAGQAKLDAQHVVVGNMVRDQYQQQTTLLPLAALMQSTTTAQLQTQLQWSTTMFDTAADTVDQLRVLQAKLDDKRARQLDLEQQVAADRQAAAANLKTKDKLKARAAADAAAVAALLSRRQSIEAAAGQDVAADKAQYAQLTRERAAVDHRIAVRIAKAKAEAARRAAAERRARAAAAAAARRAAEKARKAHTSVPSRSSSGSGGGGGSSSSSGSSGLANADHGFMYPVSAAITSPFGMRFHPILHYWKLHDGTDFGAGCGTPIRAAYAGKVAERYYNIGYGNRLMIDHGVIDGKYVTTGYNHATRYVVSVGDHVKQGQVIGYVGETGFATGCHLHLMVWLNGNVVNPMTWF